MTNYQNDNDNGRADQAAEIERLRTEINLSNNQLSRSLIQLKNYEQQLELFDRESLEYNKIPFFGGLRLL